MLRLPGLFLPHSIFNDFRTAAFFVSLFLLYGRPKMVKRKAGDAVMGSGGGSKRMRVGESCFLPVFALRIDDKSWGRFGEDGPYLIGESFPVPRARHRSHHPRLHILPQNISHIFPLRPPTVFGSRAWGRRSRDIRIHLSSPFFSLLLPSSPILFSLARATRAYAWPAIATGRLTVTLFLLPPALRNTGRQQ